jgi:hypothetical protein
VIFWRPDARWLVRLDDAVLHSLPVWLASSEPLDWDARHDISPTSHVGKLATRAEARGHLTVDERRTRDANRFRVSTDNSAKRSESGRWS